MATRTVSKFFVGLIASLTAVVNLPIVAVAQQTTANPSAELAGGSGGQLHFFVGEAKVCTLAPFIADKNWSQYAAQPVGDATAAPFPYEVDIGEKKLDGEFSVANKDGAVSAAWNFSAAAEVPFEALTVATEFPVPALADGSWEVDGTKGRFPPTFGGAHLFGNRARLVTVTFPDQRALHFSFPEPVDVTIQDNRQWGEAAFTLRFGRSSGSLAAQEHYRLEMTINSLGGLRYTSDLPDYMKPVVLKAGSEWIPLKDELDIVPGSALDLSSLGFTDGPCGSKGRIIVTPEGRFACADEPGKSKRFYGVNLCFTANYLPKDRVDKLLDRLVRLGYNAVRIHHYESALTNGQPGFAWDPAKVDQLDYLMAGCAKRGIWMTTDLFVSRPISGQQIGLGDSKIEMEKYKVLVPVYEPAYRDWTTFARKFLDRVNPYTGKRVADDPALAWISLVNEGPVSNGWGEARLIPEWTTAWNRWLAARYPSRAELETALGDLAAQEDPAQNTVALPAALLGEGPRSRLCQVFAADTEKAAFERMRDFLRQELKCPALLTNMNNAGPGVVPLEETRAAYDYVDEHFYVDHPKFLQKPWRLPSFCASFNPVAAGASGSSNIASVRLFGKPFTVTEFNYAGPGRYRGVGGVITGAMASLQDWDAVWRFAYSHSDVNLSSPAPISYFDLVSDPLNQAADRMAVFLYLRRDLTTAPSRIAMALPEELLRHPDRNYSLSALQAAAWKTQIGNVILRDGAQAPGDVIPIPIQAGKDKEVMNAALSKLPMTAAPDGSIRSETGEFALTPTQGVLTIDAARSAGGYADAGKSIDAPRSGVKIDGLTAGASVFVNSLDAAQIRSSKRLLITHLTDLQNTGCRYGEAARQTLLAWGTLPHLVRDGSAAVHIALAQPEAYTVWTLATNGKRLEKVESRAEAGQLVFTASVRGAEGARMLYEVVRD